MPEFFANNASSTLAAGIGSGDTTLDVQTGDGALWPVLGTDEWCWSTISDGTIVEIVKVTARASDTLTIERAQQGTTAQAWDAADTVQLRLTRDTLSELQGRVDYITSLSASNYFEAQSTADLDGDDFLWVQVLYRRASQGARALICGRIDGSGGWALYDEGYDIANPSVTLQFWCSTGGMQTVTANVNGVFARHWVHVGVKVSSITAADFEATLYLAGSSRASSYNAGADGFTAAGGSELFTVGNLGTIEIAGFAQRQGAAIGTPTDAQMAALFDACYAADDVVAGGLTWDHIWSVKRDTPGATWAADVGGLSLDRVGAPTNSYQTKPHWL